MTDVTTHQPLRVSNEGSAGPYIRLPLDQVGDVKRLLDDRGVRYWVAENSISWDGGPYFTIINLGREGDAAVVQSILDSAR